MKKKKKLKKLIPIEALFKCRKAHYHEQKGYDRNENKKVIRESCRELHGSLITF